MIAFSRQPIKHSKTSLNKEGKKYQQYREVMKTQHLQLYALVPHDNVSRKDEGLYINNVGVSSLCSNIQPFALER